MDYERMSIDHDTAQLGMTLPQAATPAESLINENEPTGAAARELSGLPPLTGHQIREMNLQARYGGTVPAWRRALDAAIQADPRGRAGVAEKLGVSRPYVSRVVNFHMPVAPASFIERVAAVYLRVQCPHLGQEIAPAECRTYSGRTYSACSQFEVDHWRACQRCPNRVATLVPAKAEGGLL